MSSGTKSKSPKKKAQPKKALPSGEQPQQGSAGGGGGASEEDLPETITIDLVKISPVVWSDAANGKSVQVVKHQSGEFEVLLEGKKLGCVPPDYDDLLASKASYRGVIVYRREKPIGIRIEVRL